MADSGGGAAAVSEDKFQSLPPSSAPLKPGVRECDLIISILLFTGTSVKIATSNINKAPFKMPLRKTGTFCAVPYGEPRVKDSTTKP